MGVYLGSNKVGTILEVDTSSNTLKGMIDNTVVTVNIPEGTTQIAWYAFYQRNTLENVTIPNTVTKIEDNAFAYTTVLENIIIPDSVTVLKRQAFTNSGVKTITFGSGVTEIPDSACNYCSKLTEVNFRGLVTKLNQYAFGSCGNLVNCNIPDTVTTIGQQCFNNCKKLTEITIPDGVSTLPTYTFGNCTALTKVTLGSGLTDLSGSQIFAGCKNVLVYDFTRCLQVPVLGNINNFSNINSNCKIYVPDNLYDEWIVATNWSNYASYIAKASEMV